MIKVVNCRHCDGAGHILDVPCIMCAGTGKIEQRVLPSQSRPGTYFRGALIKRNERKE